MNIIHNLMMILIFIKQFIGADAFCYCNLLKAEYI